MRAKEEVIEEVCNRHNMLISSVMTRSNLTEVVRVRRAIAIELKREGYGVCEIGRALHRGHAAILNLLDGGKQRRSQRQERLQKVGR